MGSQPRRGSTTLLWGLLVGVVLAVLIVLVRLVVAGQVRHAGLGEGLVSLLLSRGVLYVVGLALFFLAGFLAARRTGAVESGLLAGLLAGVLAGVTNLVFVLLAAGAANRRLEHAAAARALLPALHVTVGSAIFGGVVAFLAVSFVGAGVGALGGLAGRGASGGTRGGHATLPHGPTPPYGYAPFPPAPAPAPPNTFGSYTPSLGTSDVPPPPPGLGIPPMPPRGYTGDDTPTIQTSQP